MLLLLVGLPNTPSEYDFLWYIFGLYDFLPLIIGKIFDLDLNPHVTSWLLLLMVIQILLVSYLVCKFRLANKLSAWLKKRRGFGGHNP